MSEEKAILEEAMDNLREAHQRIRASQGRMRSAGLSEHLDYRDLSTRLSMALASVEAAYMEARRHSERKSKRE